MKKILMGVAASYLCVAGFMPAVAAAQDDATNSSNSEETSEQKPVDDATTDVADKSTKRKERIEEYKKSVTDKISAAKEKRLASVCKAAQGKVTSHENNVSKAITNRKGIYENISSRLTKVIEKLKAASIDTTELEAALTEVETQSAAIVAAAEEYQTTLADLAEMDCTVDPAGFQAALTAAREQRAALVELAKALKQYIQQDVKSILQTIKQQLESTKPDDSGDTSESQPGEGA